MKSEPDVFSIEDLAKVASEPWDGIRNYQARNFIKTMKHGDQAFFYHSNCKVPGIVGTMKVVKEHYPDSTAFDKKSKYYDPKSHPDQPRWFMVDVKLDKIFKETISLQDLKEEQSLQDMPLVRRGNRLSIMPLEADHWKFILKMRKK